MSIVLQVTVADKASALIKELGLSLSPERCIKSAAQGVQTCCVSHFGVLAMSRHHGQSGSNFYGDAAKSTARSDALSFSGGMAVLSIDKLGIAQRYFGGQILPKNSKSLTIPAKRMEDRVKGRSAREVFDEMHLRFSFRHGPKTFGSFVATGEVAAQIVPKRKYKGKFTGFKQVASTIGDVVVFWLSRGVDQNADPSVLPTEDEMRDAAWAGTRNYIEGITAGRN